MSGFIHQDIGEIRTWWLYESRQSAATIKNRRRTGLPLLAFFRHPPWSLRGPTILVILWTMNLACENPAPFPIPLGEQISIGMYAYHNVFERFPDQVHRRISAKPLNRSATANRAMGE
jgi:hypothetical protein